MAIALVSHLDWNENGVDPSGNISTVGATLLVMSIGQYDNVTAVAPTISDSASNTWTLAVTIGGGSNQIQYIYYVANPATSATHNFTTFWSAGGAYPSQQVTAWSGVATSSPLDQTSSSWNSGAASAATIQPGSLTPSVNNCLIITSEGNFNSGGTGPSLTINESFTITNQDASVYGSYCGSGQAYLIQTTAAAVNPTWTLASTTNQFDYLALMAVFKPSGNTYSVTNTESGTAADSPSVGHSTYVGANTESGTAAATVNFAASTYVGALSETGSAAATVNFTSSTYVGALSESGTATATANFAASTWHCSVSESGSAADSVSETYIPGVKNTTNYFFMLAP